MLSLVTTTLTTIVRLPERPREQDPLTRTMPPAAKDPGHPVYNAIPGRYANRIGKATYTIDGKVFKTQDNDGGNTLHSGTNNWSYRFWNVTAVSSDSITFSIADQSNSSMGMIGLVTSSVTYSVTNNTWNIKITANSPEAKTRKLTHDPEQ